VRVAYFTAAFGQVVLAVAIGWVVGDALLQWVFARGGRDLPPAVALPERALASIVGFVVFCVLLMVAHAVTLGNVFGNPLAVPVIAAAVLVLGIRGRGWPRPVPWGKVIGALVVLGAIFVLPALLAGSGLRTGDTPWHLGWTQQLLAGEILPTGIVPEFARNAYPWGFHAVLATLVRLVPGSDPLVAHEAVHVLTVAGIPLTAACLARRLDRRAGWAGAGAAALIGGFGWIAAGEPDLILSPSLAHYGADLVVASPNSMYELFPPALPRELGLVLLGAAGVVMTLRTDDPGAPHGILSGAVVGLAGLVSVPMFITGVLWMIATDLSVSRGRRGRLALTMLGASAAVLALWALPVAIQFVVYGGFVDITPRLGVEWPVPSALWSWGLLLPLGLIGAALAVRTREGRARTLLAFTAATVAFLAVTILRAEFGWNPAGNATLLHQGRVWPVVHLLAAAFAGVAIVAGWAWVRERSRALAVGGIAVLFGVGAISPVFASIKLTEWIRTYERGYLYHRPDFVDGAFVPRSAEFLGANDIVRVEGSNFLGFMLWQFSGARLATFDDERLAANDARIRYKDLAAEWDETMANGGFEADYVAMRAADAPVGADPLVEGDFRDEPWVLIAPDPHGEDEDL
jgi:hypothetical protein